MELTPIGFVESTLVERSAAPKQGHEGAPDAWLVFDERVAAGLEGLQVGDDVFVLTWLHLSRRDVLRVHPRGEYVQPGAGRVHHALSGAPEPDRSPPGPDPRHRGLRIHVESLEALNETPIIDIKPVIVFDDA